MFSLLFHSKVFFFTVLHVSHPGPVSLHLNDRGFILFEWKRAQTQKPIWWNTAEVAFMIAIYRSVYVRLAVMIQHVLTTPFHLSPRTFWQMNHIVSYKYDSKHITPISLPILSTVPLKPITVLCILQTLYVTWLL